MLQNEFLLENIGCDTAENEPSKVWVCAMNPKLRRQRGASSSRISKHLRRRCRNPTAGRLCKPPRRSSGWRVPPFFSDAAFRSCIDADVKFSLSAQTNRSFFISTVQLSDMRLHFVLMTFMKVNFSDERSFGAFDLSVFIFDFSLSEIPLILDSRENVRALSVINMDFDDV